MPLFAPRRLPRPRSRRGQPLRVEVGRRTAWLRAERVPDLLDAAGHPKLLRQWDKAQRAWMVPVDRVADVVSFAEHRAGMVVTVEAVDR